MTTSRSNLARDMLKAAAFLLAMMTAVAGLIGYAMRVLDILPWILHGNP